LAVAKSSAITYGIDWTPRRYFLIPHRQLVQEIVRRALPRKGPVVQFDHQQGKAIDPVCCIGEEILLAALDVDLAEECRITVRKLPQQIFHSSLLMGVTVAGVGQGAV
jgi:hypothetical protein